MERREIDGSTGGSGGDDGPGRDPVIEAYKRDVDRSLLRENLKLTAEERLRKLQALQRFAAELRRAGRATRRG